MNLRGTATFTTEADGCLRPVEMSRTPIDAAMTIADGSAVKNRALRTTYALRVFEESIQATCNYPGASGILHIEPAHSAM